MAVKPARIALAYCAGLIDGEGCISIGKKQRVRHNNIGNNQYKNGKKERQDSYYPDYNLAVIVVQKDKRLCDWLSGNFGGSVAPVKSHNDDYFRWTIEANKALELLKKIKPYLILKKAQALVAIEFGKHKKRCLYNILTKENIAIREKFYLRLRQLKKECAVAETKPNPD
jgi:hypothetical protein